MFEFAKISAFVKELDILFFIIVGVVAFVQNISMKKYIKKIKEKQFVQPLLEIGPDHKEKVGTPTMGGLPFLIAYLVIVIILWIIGIFTAISLGVSITLAVLGYAYIGVKDDYNKIAHQDNTKGLSPKGKLILQFFVALIVGLILGRFNHSTEVSFFMFDWIIDLKLFYYPFLILVYMFMSNATNLTDGLDSLLAKTYVISLIAMAIMAMILENYEVFYYIVALMVVVIIFLRYNNYPAKIFMGDTGSLVLGALLVTFGIILKVEFLLLFIGIVYVIETLSVIIQVSYFKYTKKTQGEGKRLFLMSPFHHHLEKKGLTEKQVVRRLSIVQVIGIIIAITLFIKGVQ